MGSNMVERLLEKGHEVVVNNRSRGPVDDLVKVGAEGAYEVSELVSKLEAPRTIWLMVSHSAVDEVLNSLVPLLDQGDTIIDGGNSNYQETVRRSKELKEKGINFVDVGVSGGPSGARNGACLMIGGDMEYFEKNSQLFSDLSLGDGFGYMGKHGAGHFVKMVHNGIEYGMMQAIGEGFEVMKKVSENAENKNSESEGFKLDLPEIARVYNKGSVIESRLVGWLESAYQKHSENLEGISGEVSHSGEGQWTVEAAEKLGVPVEIIKGSLDFRIKSQGNPSYTGKVVSALRNEFGGHDVKEEK